MIKEFQQVDQSSQLVSTEYKIAPVKANGMPELAIPAAQKFLGLETDENSNTTVVIKLNGNKHSFWFNRNSKPSRHRRMIF